MQAWLLKGRKMKKLIKLYIFLFIIVVILNSCDYNSLVHSLTRKENPEEELEIIWAIDGNTYKYSDKISIFLDKGSNSNDSIYLKYFPDEGSWREILSGEFEKVAWNDYKVFCLMEDTYYVFDINSYEVPTDPAKKYDESEYELKEYSGEEMKKLYPSYESFSWYD